MNNSKAFKEAHKLAKATIKAGDSYQHVFGVCLKLVKAQAKAAADVHVQPSVQATTKMVWMESHNIGDFVFGAALSIIMAPFFAVMFTLMACAIAQLFGIDPSAKAVWAFFSGFLAVSGVMFSYAEAKGGRYQYIT